MTNSTLLQNKIKVAYVFVGEMKQTDEVERQGHILLPRAAVLARNLGDDLLEGQLLLRWAMRRCGLK